MRLLSKLIGVQSSAPGNQKSLEDDFKAMAAQEDAVARMQGDSGLVALYPELGSKSGGEPAAEGEDFDEYVPELDDYEPGTTGKYVGGDDDQLAAIRARLNAELQDVGPENEMAEKNQDTTPEKPVAATPPAQPSAPDAKRHPDDTAAPAENGAFEEEGYDDYEEEYEDEFEDDFEDDPPPKQPVLVQVPSPAAGRAGGRRAGRVKTRLLGFGHDTDTDPFEAAKSPAISAEARYPVGWIIVLKGPGRGHSFTLFDGVSPVGRGDDQAVRLDFGDTSISRSNHAIIAYDNEQRKFFIGHGGKANLVRLNDRPVLSTEELQHDDRIRIGETTLRFLALCGQEFDWTRDEEAGSTDAATA